MLQLIVFMNMLAFDVHSILEHDDSLTDRSDGGILNTNFQATKTLWKNVYGKEYKVPGGMYRGEPPMDYFNGEWAEGLGSDKATSVDAVLPGISLLHLIGEVGASSYGRGERSELNWKSIDSEEGFVAPESKSTTRGVNSNPVKDMYVFGDGGKFLFISFNLWSFSIIECLLFEL